MPPVWREHPEKPGSLTVAAGSAPTTGTAANILRTGGTTKTTQIDEYLVVIEHEGDSWGAYCPDLPGLGAAGDSRDEVERLIREAIGFHLDGLRQAGEPIPAPTAVGTTRVEIPPP